MLPHVLISIPAVRVPREEARRRVWPASCVGSDSAWDERSYGKVMSPWELGSCSQGGAAGGLGCAVFESSALMMT